jgi:hypothetical protein
MTTSRYFPTPIARPAAVPTVKSFLLHIVRVTHGCQFHNLQPSRNPTQSPPLTLREHEATSNVPSFPQRRDEMPKRNGQSTTTRIEEWLIGSTTKSVCQVDNALTNRSSTNPLFTVYDTASLLPKVRIILREGPSPNYDSDGSGFWPTIWATTRPLVSPAPHDIHDDHILAALNQNWLRFESDLVYVECVAVAEESIRDDNDEIYIPPNHSPRSPTTPLHNLNWPPSSSGSDTE